jgi:hypothetical protein
VTLSRAEFDRARQAAKAVERREGLVLAAVAVLLGVAQLVYIRWAERSLTHDGVVATAGPAFLLYMGLVVVLLVRMARRIGAARVRCPQCGAALSGMSERVAAATGSCDRCGGRVLD